MYQKFILSIILAIHLLPCIGADNYQKIDKRSKLIPDSLRTVKQISAYLTQDLKTDKEKARAIYVWVAHNIKYDLSLLEIDNIYSSTTEIINEVLKTRKGVCQHYADLFNALGQQAGLKSSVISGYTFDEEGKVAKFSHTWNAIEIDSIFYNIDPTWAAGYQLDNKYIHKFSDFYFLIKPENFVTTHVAFDPVFQLVTNPLTGEEVLKKEFKKLSIKGSYNFRDTIAKELKMTQFERQIRANDRMIANGVFNQLVRAYIENNNLQIETMSYNYAVDTMNVGVNKFNIYVEAKNRQFRYPKISDKELLELFKHAKNGILTANLWLQKVYSNDENLSRLIEDTKYQMPQLVSRIRHEQDFLDRYIKTWKPFRIFMFYSYGNSF